MNQHLQCIDDERIFAAGDCCSIDGISVSCRLSGYGARPLTNTVQYMVKAGVYAVREGPIVAENIMFVPLHFPLVSDLTSRQCYVDRVAINHLCAAKNLSGAAQHRGWASDWPIQIPCLRRPTYHVIKGILCMMNEGP